MLIKSILRHVEQKFEPNYDYQRHDAPVLYQSMALKNLYLVSRRDQSTANKQSIYLIENIDHFEVGVEELPLLDVLEHHYFEYDGYVFCRYKDANSMLEALEGIDLLDHMRLSRLIDSVCTCVDFVNDCK